MLIHHADLSELLRSELIRRLAECNALSRSGQVEARYVAKESGLSASVAPYESNDRGFVHRDRHILESCLVLERLGDIAKLKRAHVVFSSFFVSWLTMRRKISAASDGLIPNCAAARAASFRRVSSSSTRCLVALCSVWGATESARPARRVTNPSSSRMPHALLTVMGLTPSSSDNARVDGSSSPGARS